MNFIYSKFAADEDWHELIQELVAEIPQRLTLLDNAIANENLEQLSTIVHQMKGACGSYGFDQVTPIAIQLEKALHENPDLSTCRGELSEFRGALQNMTAEPASAND